MIQSQANPGSATEPSRRLVLIEDDAKVRRALQLLLQGQGFQVLSFASAAPALANPDTLAVEHIVVDYVMPQCDGVEFLEAIRRQGWNGNAVLMSGFYSKSLEAKAIAAGFSAILAKPFRDDLLLDALGPLPPRRA